MGMRPLKHMAQSIYIHSIRRTVQTHIVGGENTVTDDLKTTPDQASTDQMRKQNVLLKVKKVLKETLLFSNKEAKLVHNTTHLTQNRSGVCQESSTTVLG